MGRTDRRASGPGADRTRRGVRALVGSALVATLAMTTVGTAVAVPPPPPNPTDAELQRAADAVDGGIGVVSDLINQVAAADQALEELMFAVAARREEANKALVDLQIAQGVVAEAEQAVAVAKRQLADAGAMIDGAQEQFNLFVTASYQQGSPVGSLAAFVGTDNPEDLLARGRLLKIVSDAHEASMQRLQRARTEEANRDAAARAAKREAEDAEADAAVKEMVAQQAISAAESEAEAQERQRRRIEQDKADAEAQLAQARENIDGLQSQREVFEAWDRQRQAEEAARKAAEEAAQRAAADAARRAAENAAAQEAAGQVAAQQESGKVSGTVGGQVANSSDAQKIEIVIDRAMSQLGVRYSWGGGNANGPTMGVRDGGVADRHGDYKNIGFDCSGLMQYAFAGAGVSIPKYSGYQYTAGKQIPASQARRGDMLFWGQGGIHHVALYLGDGTMIEAPHSGSVVKISPVRYNDMAPYAVRMIG